MKALHSVLLKSEKTYNNTESINGIEYTVNISIDDVTSINRKSLVIDAPIGSDIFNGDEVIVHHNIMRKTIKTNGDIDNGHFFIANNYYHCPVSEVILRRRPNEEWETLLDFVFVKPIKEESVDVGNGLILDPYSHKGFKDLRATIAISNKNLKGVDVGDLILFSNYSEHEFIINGELMYKCRVEDILAKL